MKIWIKLLLGSCIGIGLTFLLDLDNPGIALFLKNSSEIVVRIGRYIFIPLMFFSLSVAVHELGQIKKTSRILVRSFLYLLISSAALAILGTLSVLLLKPARIPIIVEEAAVFQIPSLMDILRLMFPENFFSLFIPNGGYILPLAFLALLLGIHFNYDTITTKPVVQFFNSMNRIFYQINTLFLEILGIGMIALAAWFVLQLRTTQELILFRQVVILLSVDAVIIVGGLFPLALYLFGGKKNPYPALYGMIAPALAGFFSGDLYFAMPALIKHGKENLGIPRNVGSVSYPLYALFGRAGTALVTAVSFIVILKSYSSLGINFFGVAWVALFSFILSFAVGFYPSTGVFIAISVLCSIYGKGLEEGYLILKPLIPILISFSVMLDVLSVAFNSVLISIHEDLKKAVERSQFV